MRIVAVSVNLIQVVSAVASHVLAFAAGVLSAVLAVWYRNRIEKRRAREESVRALLTATSPLNAVLSRALGHYQHVVRIDPQHVSDLFRTGNLLPPEALQTFAAAVDRATSLPTACLSLWRSALDACRSAEQQHAGLRDLIGRPGFRAKIIDRRHEYAEELRSAIESIRSAASETQSLAPPDARSSITELSRKG